LKAQTLQEDEQKGPEAWAGTVGTARSTLNILNSYSEQKSWKNPAALR